MTRIVITPSVRKEIIRLARKGMSSKAIIYTLQIDVQPDAITKTIVEARKEGFVIPYRHRGNRAAQWGRTLDRA